MPDRLSVAIVGTGIGRDHLLGFRARPDLWTVATVCDIDRGRAERLAAEFGVGQVATDLAAVLADQTVDIVDLCTPPHLHYQQISASIAAGKHVICEKPLVGSLADIDRLEALCRDAPVRLMPIFQKRFGAGLYRLRHLMAQGLAGRPFVATAETHWRRAADYYAVPWRGKWATEMGGVNLTQAIHAHDIVTHVMGPVARVFAANRTAVNPIEVEDCSAAVLEFANGSLATLSATLGAATQTSRLRFVFEHLTVESNSTAYEFTGDPWTFTAPDAERQRAVDSALADLPETYPAGESFAGQFAAFHHALVTGTTPPVTLADSRQSLELVTAIYHSARCGDPVSLPLAADHPGYGSWLPPDRVPPLTA